MPQVLWTPVAESDLDDILFYIALVDRNPATGERIYFEIRDRVTEQAANPPSGHRHPAAPEGWSIRRSLALDRLNACYQLVDRRLRSV